LQEEKMAASMQWEKEKDAVMESIKQAKRWVCYLSGCANGRAQSQSYGTIMGQQLLYSLE
jgi:hypothetical protein